MAQRLLLRKGLAGRLRVCYYSCTPSLHSRQSLYSACSFSHDFFFTQNRAVRCFGSTTLVLKKEEEKSMEETKKVQKEQDDDKKKQEDEVPPWQNPLHVGNPDYQPKKVFQEDFAPGEEIPKVPLPPLEDGSSGNKVMAPPHLHDLADQIVNLTMLEMNDLTNKIGEHFGFEDNVGVVMGGGGDVVAGGDAAAEEKEAPKEEKTAFDLKLTGFDAKAKIKVIKEVRAIGGFGLKEAKELVEGAPKTIKKGIKMEEAEELKKKLEDVGATVEIA